jgi:hypothetical protein
VRAVAAHSGISKSTVARYFALFGLQPHRSKSFKGSTAFESSGRSTLTDKLVSRTPG